MMQTSLAAPYDQAHSRRSGPRIEVLGQLHGQLVPMDVPLVIRNLSAGGFGVESRVPFAGGSVHLFRLTTPSGLGVVVTGELKFCYSVEFDDRPTRYRAGFAFVHEPGGATAQAIELLLDAATSVLTFQ